MLIGFLLGAGLIIVLNWHSFATMYGPGVKICFDCGATAGFPFVMYNSGYIWGGEGFIPSGVFANATFGFLAGGVSSGFATWFWRLIRRRFKSDGLK